MLSGGLGWTQPDSWGWAQERPSGHEVANLKQAPCQRSQGGRCQESREGSVAGGAQESPSLDYLGEGITMFP